VLDHPAERRHIHRSRVHVTSGTASTKNQTKKSDREKHRLNSRS
jgi:hypothetical protein